MEPGPGNSLAASAVLFRRRKGSIPPTTAAPATPIPNTPKKRRREVPVRALSICSGTFRQLRGGFQRQKSYQPPSPVSTTTQPGCRSPLRDDTNLEPPSQITGYRGSAGGCHIGNWLGVDSFLGRPESDNQACHDACNSDNGSTSHCGDGRPHIDLDVGYIRLCGKMLHFPFDIGYIRFGRKRIRPAFKIG